MSCLLYCIFRDSVCVDYGADSPVGYQNPDTLAGFGGQPVFTVSNSGLGAALSKIIPSIKKGTCSISAPGISLLLDYERVVKAFLRDRTVIPMRYGCLFEEKSQVFRLLQERRLQYMELLTELEGCVEMGIRALISDRGTQTAVGEISNPRNAIFTQKTSLTGREYLNARSAHYAREERFAEKNRLLAERCRTAFAGLFVKCKSEDTSFRGDRSLIRNPLLSLYFLVPRRSIEPFRLAFKQICSKESAKLMLSGPWPPYNFVTPIGRAELGSRGV
jgi:hypothetical protein